MQFSPDGQWFWDGAQWRPAYSPDRAWRWDGTRWVPAAPPPPRAWRYEPTAWTRRLQVILIALTVLGLLASILLLPGVLTSILQQSIDRAIAQQPPDPNVDPVQLRQFLTGFVNGTLIVAAAVSAVWLVVIVVGIVRLWRWVFWYTLAVYLLSLLSIPQNVLYAMGVGPIRMPGWWIAFIIPSALIQAGVAVGMFVLYRRYGTWARRRLPA